MHFEIERDAFLEGLSKTVPITEKRTTLPILSHVLFDAKDSKLVLIATDLEVGLKISYDCTVKEEGSLTVPSKKIYEIIRELRSGPVTVEEKENSRIKIIAGQSTFELAGMDAADYPAWAALEEVNFVSIQAADLLYMIDKTLFASSNDESRYNLNGVLFEEEDDHTRLVATDGHRLASISRSLGMALQSKLVVPKKGLLELRRILEGIKGEISIGFEQKNIVIQTDRFVMTVRLIEGEYPDYRKVIPAGTGRLIKIDRAQLLQTAKRVAILTSERNKGVNVNVGANLIELTATHPDLGTARDVIDVDYSGEEFNLIINAAYLIEALNVVDSDTITLEYHRDGAPIVLRPEPTKDYFNLVMPMRK
jgi:DNA polymerase III subunit beta